MPHKNALLGIAIACLLAGCGLTRQTTSVNTLYRQQRDPLTAAEHVRLGQIYQGQGKWELAEREFHQALRRQTDYPAAWSALGVLAFQRGQLQQAEEYFRQAFLLSPVDRQVLNNLAWTYVKHAEETPQEVSPMALRRLASRLEQVVRQPDEQGYYYWDTLGMLYVRLKEWSRANECFQQAWQLTPPEQKEFIQELAVHQALAQQGSPVP